MGIVSNMIILSGGKFNPNKPIIHASAALGSTVTFSFNGAVEKTIGADKAFPSIDGESADYYYQPNNTGVYTVTATASGTSISKTVTVSDAEQYDVYLTRRYFFKSGIGEIVPINVAMQYNISVSVGLESIVIGNPGSAGVYTQEKIYTPKIDLTDFSSIVFDLVLTTATTSGVNRITFGASNLLATESIENAVPSFAAYYQPTSQSSTRQLFTINVSNLSGRYYIGSFGVWRVGNLYNIYAEP